MDLLIRGKSAAVTNVVEAFHLKRSLYLAFQLTELGLRVILGLNMMDIVERTVGPSTLQGSPANQV